MGRSNKEGGSRQLRQVSRTPLDERKAMSRERDYNRERFDRAASETEKATTKLNQERAMKSAAIDDARKGVIERRATTGPRNRLRTFSDAEMAREKLRTEFDKKVEANQPKIKKVSGEMPDAERRQAVDRRNLGTERVGEARGLDRRASKGAISATQIGMKGLVKEANRSALRKTVEAGARKAASSPVGRAAIGVGRALTGVESALMIGAWEAGKAVDRKYHPAGPIVDAMRKGTEEKALKAGDRPLRKPKR